MKMKIKVCLDLKEQDFEDNPSLVLRELLEQVADKIMRQSYRLPGSVCAALEEDDVVRSVNGNVVGSIVVKPRNGRHS
jgi:hypothetical protein